MKSRRTSSVLTLIVLFVLAWPQLSYGAEEAQRFDPDSHDDAPGGQTIFEVIGQVKNSPSPGPGFPATSVQYGYLSYVPQLTDNETFLPGSVQNDTTAVFTFYNESTTLRVTPHGRWNIIVREGTMTVYYHPSAGADLTTPNPDSFRSGTPIQTSTWRHQVIIEPTPSGLFFVTFTNTITSSSPVYVGGKRLRLGKPGGTFRMSLVGGPDPAGLVNGKFAGTAIATSE